MAVGFAGMRWSDNLGVRCATPQLGVFASIQRKAVSLFGCQFPRIPLRRCPLSGRRSTLIHYNTPPEWLILRDCLLANLFRFYGLKVEKTRNLKVDELQILDCFILSE